MPRAKEGRDEFAIKFVDILCKPEKKYGRWQDYKDDPRVHDIIAEAREKFQYSEKTRNSEIFLSLRGVCNVHCKYMEK